MKKIKRSWTIEEKIAIIQDIEKIGVTEGCRKHGIYQTTFYEWKKKYDQNGADGLIPRYKKQENRDLKKLEKENEELKKLLAEKELQIKMQQELIKKKMQQWKR